MRAGMEFASVVDHLVLPLIVPEGFHTRFPVICIWQALAFWEYALSDCKDISIPAEAVAEVSVCFFFVQSLHVVKRQHIMHICLMTELRLAGPSLLTVDKYT